ncbi:MAG: DNA primase, partial [Actinomycetia bacterium]|nr:DNA primase [Actinomycetes bacterium]
MSFFTEEDINEVRERSDLVEIVSQYVSLKKLGNSHKGLCPFHQEKTASFFVNSTKQLYHCFGCGEGGNVFTFVSKMEKLEFPDALKLLADRIGYKLRYSQENKKRISREEKLYKINQEALNVYHEQLIKSERGKKALNYLLKRGFNKNTLDVFKIGFSFPGWDTLTKRMMKEGYPLKELIQAGLSIEGTRGPYDRFRGRVIFPICDLRKRIIGFGARIIEENKEEPKYVNTPE